MGVDRPDSGGSPLSLLLALARGDQVVDGLLEAERRVELWFWSELRHGLSPELCVVGPPEALSRPGQHTTVLRDPHDHGR